MPIDTDLFFDGKVNMFKQMPLVEDKEGLEKVYKYAEQIQKENFKK